MSNEFINIGSANSSPEHFQLRYISISKYEGDWQSLPHTHHFSELFYVLRGEGAFYIENEKVPVKTDDLVIINPYVEHTEKTLPNDPMEYIVFGVDGLAFSFSGAGQDNPKGYSFYSYGSDKKQFINFAQLMMQEFPALNRCATDCSKCFWYIFPGSRICPSSLTPPSSCPRNVLWRSVISIPTIPRTLHWIPWRRSHISTNSIWHTPLPNVSDSLRSIT